MPRQQQRPGLALLLRLCLGLLAAPAAAEAEPAGAAGLRAQAARDGRVRVIVELAAPAPRGAAADAAASPAAALGAGARPLGSLPFAALDVDAAGLEALLASGAVLRVGENRRVRPSLRQSVPLIDAPEAVRLGADGAGQHVVIVDTGVRASHPFLAGRVVKSLCSAVDCGARVVDRPGAGEPHPACRPGTVVADHGTHVAGIAAGRGAAFSGVAPKARLISIRVFRCEDADTLEYVIRALDYVATDLAGSYRIAAVNLSLSDDLLLGSACDGQDAAHAALSTVIGKLRRLGIATVAASGNEGSKTGVGAPACIADAIAVGSTGKDDRTSWFSNSAPVLDLLAPGDEITSSLAGGGFGPLSGTSMAAPHVAGAFAALRSKVPGATVAAIEAALKAAGRPIRDPENGLVRPRIDVDGALARLLAAAPTASWGAWESFPGRLARGGGPECLARDAARVDCWAPLAGGSLGWWRYAGAGRPAPVDLGGSVAATPSCLRAGSDLHCFAATRAGALAQRTQRAGRWLAWRDLGGNVRGRPACLSADGRRIDCVARGADGRLRARAFDGRSWGAAWRAVAPGLTAAAAPACHPRDGRVECLVVGTDARVRQIQLGADGAWTAPRGLGGAAAAEAGSCVEMGSDGRRRCFFVAPDRTLRAVAFDGQRWGPWRNLGGALTAGPSCVRAGDAVHCVAVGRAGAVQERRLDAGGAWQPWRGLRGLLAAEPPACVAPTPARVDCFGVASADRGLRHVAYR